MGADFDTLREHCRAAGLGDYDWSLLLREIAEWVGGTKAMFLGIGGSGPYRQTLEWNHDPAALDRYNTRYNMFDPRAPYSRLTPLHFCQLGQQYVRNEEIAQTEYFEAINRFGDVRDSVHGIIGDDAEIGRQTISIQRGFAQEFFSRAEADKLAALLPVIEQAIRDSMRIARVLGASAGRGEFAYLLVDAGLNVQIFEEVGNSAILSNGGPARVDNHRLMFDYEIGETLALDAIRQALEGRNARFRLGPMELAFSPVPAPLHWLGGSEAVFATVSPYKPRDTSQARLFAAAYNFSEREAEILAVLLRIPDLREAAKRVGVSYETLRWHVKNMCQKCGHDRRGTMLAKARLGQFDIPDVIE